MLVGREDLDPELNAFVDVVELVLGRIAFEIEEVNPGARDRIFADFPVRDPAHAEVISRWNMWLAYQRA